MTAETCSVETCDRRRYCRGWCKPHYERWRIYGTLENRPWPKATLDERFWPKVAEGPDGCWLWTAAINVDGYGVICSEPGGRPRMLLAHRAAWLLLRGDIPDGLQLDHLCRVRECVNPDHLEPVDAATNTYRSLNKNIRAFLAGTCTRGHALDENSYVNPSTGYRLCRICLRRKADLRRVAA